ncbi:MAG: glucuronyl hydrolase [Pseudonocardiales bacterium]
MIVPTAGTPPHLDMALELVLDRVGRVAEQVDDRFPLFADPTTGQWTTSRRGSWTGGFWAGLWWLRVAVLGDGESAVARAWTRRLAPRAADDTATRGMTFWYGAGSGYRLTGDLVAAEVATLGGAALAAAFDFRHQLVPFGSAFDRPGRPPRPRAVIDPLAGVVALLCGGAAARAGRRQLARAHAARHVELCLSPNGAVRSEVALRASGGGSARAGRGERARVPRGGGAAGRPWARGQAWGMLGFAVAARDLDAEFAEPARRCAAWWLEQVGAGGIPHAVLADPICPLDTSAAAIAAAALLTLAALGGPGSAEQHAAAVCTVENLVEHHLRDNGVLGEGCYDHTRDLAPAHELVWGTYFLAATLAVLSGRVEQTPW